VEHVLCKHESERLIASSEWSLTDNTASHLGGVTQLVECHPCTVEVEGSSPFASTPRAVKARTLVSD